MSDVRVRALERAALAGDASARAALLLERVRSGTLAPARLALAAYVGDPAAQAALGDATPAGALSGATLDEVGAFAWALGLRPWGQEACVRVALSVAREVLPLAWEEPGLGALADAALAAAEAWLACPCEEHRHRADAAANVLVPGPSGPGREATHAATSAAATAGAREAFPSPEARVDAEAREQVCAADAVYDALCAAEMALETAAALAPVGAPDAAPRRRVDAALQARVVPWALAGR